MRGLSKTNYAKFILSADDFQRERSSEKKNVDLPVRKKSSSVFNVAQNEITFDIVVAFAHPTRCVIFVKFATNLRQD